MEETAAKNKWFAAKNKWWLWLRLRMSSFG